MILEIYPVTWFDYGSTTLSQVFNRNSQAEPIFLQVYNSF